MLSRSYSAGLVVVGSGFAQNGGEDPLATHLVLGGLGDLDDLRTMGHHSNVRRILRKSRSDTV